MSKAVRQSCTAQKKIISTGCASRGCVSNIIDTKTCCAYISRPTHRYLCLHTYIYICHSWGFAASWARLRKCTQTQTYIYTSYVRPHRLTGTREQVSRTRPRTDPSHWENTCQIDKIHSKARVAAVCFHLSQLNVGHDSCTCVMWFIRMCGLTKSSAHTRLIRIWDIYTCSSLAVRCSLAIRWMRHVTHIYESRVTRMNGTNLYVHTTSGVSNGFKSGLMVESFHTYDRICNTCDRDMSHVWIK